jgi:hypothetical protein
VVLRVEADIGQDLPNQGQDPGVVRVCLKYRGAVFMQEEVRGNNNYSSRLVKHGALCLC